MSAQFTSYGPGDSVTWPACNSDPMDPRTEIDDDDSGTPEYLSVRAQIKRVQDLLDESLYALACDKVGFYQEQISVALMRLQELVEETTGESA